MLTTTRSTTIDAVVHDEYCTQFRNCISWGAIFAGVVRSP